MFISTELGLSTAIIMTGFNMCQQVAIVFIGPHKHIITTITGYASFESQHAVVY